MIHPPRCGILLIPAMEQPKCLQRQDLSGQRKIGSIQRKTGRIPRCLVIIMCASTDFVGHQIMGLPKNISPVQLVPTEFVLSQNYPNPFTEKTTIKFCVGCRTKVKLEVLDSEGRIVERLLDNEMDVGTYRVDFSAKGIRDLPDGTYVCKLEAGDFRATKEMHLFRKEASPCGPSST